MAISHLLSDFIGERLREYVEPSKIGTRKGERVGFSKAKFHATLLSALTASRETEIADKLKVSYGLLRKWHVETEFKQELTKHVTEFSQHFWKAIKANAETMMSRYLEKRSKLNIVPYSFQDVYGYSTGLALSLCTDADQIADELEQPTPSRTDIGLIFYALEVWRCLPALRMAVGSHTPEAGRPRLTPDLAPTHHGSKAKIPALTKKSTTKIVDEIRYNFLRASQSLEAGITEAIFELLSQPEGSEQRLAVSALRQVLRQERERRRLMQILI